MPSHQKHREFLAHMVKKNNIDSVKVLIEENCEACQGIPHFRKGDSALHLAARLGLSDMVKLLLDHVAVNSTNNDGKTPLHEAASAGHCEIVKLLLKSGAEINCLKAADWTPLMMACAKPHLKVVEVLVTAGASLSYVNKDGWTAFHIAAREGDVQVLALLLQADKTCWNTVSKNKRSPLHSAVIHGRYECTQFLLSTSSQHDVNGKDSCGSTPLMDALRKGCVDIAALLLEHGASLHATNTLGRSCFHVVAEAGEVESLNYLCAASGEDGAFLLNAVDDRGSTPLHLAAKEGHVEMVKALVKAGVNANFPDLKGRTARDIAMACGKAECAELLE